MEKLLFFRLSPFILLLWDAQHSLIPTFFNSEIKEGTKRKQTTPSQRHAPLTAITDNLGQTNRKRVTYRICTCSLLNLQSIDVHNFIL